MGWRWMGLALLVGVVTAAAAAAPDTKVRFDGFRVYRVVPTTQTQVEFLKDLEKQENDYTFWTRPVLENSVDIMVSPFLRIDFRDLARAVGLAVEIFIDDVQKLIDEENPKARLAGDFGWEAYYALGDVYEWLQTLPTTYKDNVKIINLGKTTEGRDILGLKIFTGEDAEVGTSTKKSIFVESGIHAREWITVATTTYLINKLLTSDDDKIKNLIEVFDWYIVPSTNPDGYEYTHYYNRLWRKTRSPRAGSDCFGADPNRNWEYKWNDDRGSSGNPCSETYRGSTVFSEPETRNIKEYLEKFDNPTTNNLLVYFCIHSYSQVLMAPYGLPDDEADNWPVLKQIGDQAVVELAKRNETSYSFNNIYTAIKYEASGGSMDWVKKVLEVTYTFEWELRDKGRYGFLLPASQIIDTAEETIDSMVYILEEVQTRESLTGGGASP